ncbi:DUF3572 family protein [Roseovarius spongiae]|uniref:DUF3572 family protein n=1 Tax=Roseovarius spongiae TaxID=2320272 RepID=A0A3A8AXC2_9RHOB|nr:DUF3572 domain-containing protein [Roseovarius spongiae]RKF16386.1 DUF3572 family protein [Roseovarius spongiae]
MPQKQEAAETVGLRCLAWLIGNEDLLPVFMGASGATEADLREGAQDPAFLGAVLDFVMMDDAWVIAFCEAEGLAPEAPARARMALPGGQEMSWT